MIKMICKKAIELIKHYESLHDNDLSIIGLQPKMCPAGIWTAGWGHALCNKEGEFLKGAADKAEAYAKYPNMALYDANELLDTDLMVFVKAVNRLVTASITQNEMGALVSFAYNCGSGNLKASTLLKKLNAGNFLGAADEFLRWDKSAGKKLKGLTLRRAAERELFLEPGLAYVSAG
jgi:lysozyme